SNRWRSCGSISRPSASAAGNSPSGRSIASPAFDPSARSVLDQSAQAIDRRVPLGRDLVEIAARVGEPAGLHLPDPLAAVALAADEARVRQGVQVLGDRLAR